MKKAFGVCEWLGSIFGINPALIRKFFIYSSFLTLGSPLLIYFPLAYFLENIDKLKFRKKGNQYGILNNIDSISNEKKSLSYWF